MVGDALQQQLEFVDVEGLGDVFVGAMLHGLQRRLHRAVAGHQDHQSLGTLRLDVAEGLQAVDAGEPQIEQNGVDAMGLQRAISLLGAVGDIGGEAQREDFAARHADRTFVVDDQEVKKVGGQNLGSVCKASESG